jgi:hypothetical protein
VTDRRRGGPAPRGREEDAMDTGIKVYLAGPYSRPDCVENTHNTIKAADRLWAAGLVPYVPHLSLAYHLVSPKPYADWLAYDLHWVAACDALLRLPGESAGADGEVRHAEELGIPVFLDESELVRWAQVEAKLFR